MPAWGACAGFELLAAGLLSASVAGPAPTPSGASPPLPPDPAVRAGATEKGVVEAPTDVARTPEPPAPSARTHGVLRAEVQVLGSADRVEGVRAFVDDGESPVRAEQAGALRIWLTPGTHRIELRASGFLPARFEVEIERGVELRRIYRLEEDLDAPRYYTLVESEREVAVSRVTLVDEEIHTLPGSRGDPFAVVKSLPGAAQVAGFLPYVVVRGAAPGNTGYFLDSVRVPLLFHVAAGPAVIHPYFIDSVDFYPGGVPVRLGRYASGVIEGRTREADPDRVRGEVDLRLTDSGALLHLPFDRRRVPGCLGARRDCDKQAARGTLTLAGRYSYTGAALSLVPALNVALAFWDYQLRLDHPLGPRADYRAFAYGAYDSIGPDREFRIDDMGETVVDENPDPLLRFHFHRFDQRIRTRLRPDTRTELGLALGVDETGTGPIKTRMWRVAPRAIWTRTLSERAELGVGLDQDFQVFRLDRSIAEIDPSNAEDFALFLSERFVSLTGLWSDLRWRRGIVELRPGLRVDAYVQVGASPVIFGARSASEALGVDPRMLAREQVHERVALKQSIGVYHQPASAPIPIPGIESLGFAGGLQRNVQGSFGYEWRLGARATLSQEAYLGRLSNLQDYEFAEAETGGNDELEDFIIHVTGWAYGLETMLRVDPRARVYGWVAYTLSRSTRNYRVGGQVPGPWDQTHIANMVLGYKLGPKWRLGGRLHVNSGRPYTAQIGEQTLAEALAENRNNRRLPPFFQVDARIERIFVRQVYRVHLFLDLTNATLSREILSCSPNPGAEDLPPSTTAALTGCADPIGIRYVLPSLGVRGVF